MALKAKKVVSIAEEKRAQAEEEARVLARAESLRKKKELATRKTAVRLEPTVAGAVVVYEGVTYTLGPATTDKVLRLIGVRS